MNEFNLRGHGLKPVESNVSLFLLKEEGALNIHKEVA